VLSKQPNQIGNAQFFMAFSRKHCCRGYAIMRPMCTSLADPHTLLYYIVLYLHKVEKEGCVSFSIVVSTVVLRVSLSTIYMLDASPL
jgi:hypothetical protein